MDNPLLNIADEELDKEESGKDDFIIDNDNLAEWALTKIKQERIEAQRLDDVCDNQIEFYKEKKEHNKDQLEQKTNFLTSKLYEYFSRVNHHGTKTQETYKLPSGTLKLKHPKPKYNIDNDKLVKWLKTRGMKDYIKIEEIPKWNELKKNVVTTDQSVVDENGEIVDGIEITETQPEFKVDIQGGIR